MPIRGEEPVIQEDHYGLVRLKTPSQTMAEEAHGSHGDEPERDLVTTEAGCDSESHIYT